MGMGSPGRGEGEGKKSVGKAAVEEKLQSWRRSTKPAPRRDFSTGRLWCDPKVKLSALTGVVGIQIDPGGGKLCLSACVKPVNEI